MVRAMDQISRPLLLALVAVVGLAGVWMTVLRPRAQGAGDSAAAPVAAAAAPAQAPSAPGVKGLARAVEKAHGAVAASKASAVATEGGRKAATAGSAASPAADAARAVDKPAPPVRPAAADSPVTVLLFAGDGADDEVARRVVQAARRPGVRTIVAPIERVGRYADLIGSVEIPGAPTILVIGPDRQAQRIVGLPDAAQVEQALAAAR